MVRPTLFGLARWAVAVMLFWMYTGGRIIDDEARVSARACACSRNEISSFATVALRILIRLNVAAETAELPPRKCQTMVARGRLAKIVVEHPGRIDE